MRTIILLLAGLLLAPVAFAQYRCVENGKTTFTDKPCPGDVAPAPPVGNGPKVIGDAGNSAYSTSNGTWRGQVQFQALQNGQPIPEAHAVIQAVISIESQGKVTGGSPDNGCKVVGIAKPGSFPTMVWLDVTLSGCKYQRFNRRLFGSVIVYQAEKHAQIDLHSQPMNLLNPGNSFDIKGTMRR